MGNPRCTKRERFFCQKSPEKFFGYPNLSVSNCIYICRTQPVTQTDSKQIVDTKNDPQEVAIALQNIRKRAAYLYEFQGIEKRANVTKSVYKENEGVTLYYQVSEAGASDIPGYLFVFEYPKGKEQNMPRSAFNSRSNVKLSDPSKTFDANGIHWSLYGNHILRGEKDGVYYEIQTQGDFTYEKLVELLAYFKPSNR